MKSTGGREPRFPACLQVFRPSPVISAVLAGKEIVLVLSRAATVLVLVIEKGNDDGLAADSSGEMKLKLKRIVSMLTRMVMKTDGVAESPAGYDAADIDYEHEHRCAEHEHVTSILNRVIGRQPAA
jgi:hypothetical protein